MVRMYYDNAISYLNDKKSCFSLTWFLYKYSRFNYVISNKFAKCYSYDNCLHIVVIL